MAVLKRSNIVLTNVKMAESRMGAQNSSGVRSEAGILTVINSKKNGKRVTFNHDSWEVIGRPVSVDISFTKDYLILMAGDRFRLSNLTEEDIQGTSKKKAKPIIYSYGLVAEIVETFALDYSNCVSQTFTEGEITEYDGKVCVAIRMTKR